MQVIYIVLIIIAVWLAALTLFGIYIYTFFRKLTAETDKGNIITIINKVLDDQKLTRKEFSEVREELLAIREMSKTYLQKVGFVRFNPFEELGGDHSFSLALLDGRDSGFVVTGLHTRERTRIYVKNIKRGKPELELSVEEKQALKLAQR